MNVDDNCADTRFVQQYCPGYGAYWQKWQKWTTINFAEERKKEVYRKINRMMRL